MKLLPFSKKIIAEAEPGELAQWSLNEVRRLSENIPATPRRLLRCINVVKPAPRFNKVWHPWENGRSWDL